MKYFYLAIVILINLLRSNVKTQFDPTTGELITPDSVNVENTIQYDPITGKSITPDTSKNINLITNYTFKDLSKSQKKEYNKRRIVVRRVNKGYLATLISAGNGWEASHVSFILFHSRIETEDFFILTGYKDIAVQASENRRLRNRNIPLATASFYLPLILSDNYGENSAAFTLFQIGGMVGAFYFIYDYSIKKHNLPTYQQASTIADEYNNNLIQTLIGK